MNITNPDYRGKRRFDYRGGDRQYALSKSEGPKVVFKRGRHIITIPNEQKWPLGVGDKSKTAFFIKHFGRRQKEMARHVRFWTGHMPCRAFRERFHLEGHIYCWYCKAYEGTEVLETRDHVLLECRGWGRAFTDYHIVYKETDVVPGGPGSNQKKSAFLTGPRSSGGSPIRIFGRLMKGTTHAKYVGDSESLQATSVAASHIRYSRQVIARRLKCITESP